MFPLAKLEITLKMRKQQKLKVANATLLINGTTIHSLLGLLINKRTTISKLT
jgi:hypothetical protein